MEGHALLSVKRISHMHNEEDIVMKENCDGEHVMRENM